MTKDRTSSVARADSDGASTMDLTGRCVGNSYVLQHPIGQGATGTVWRGIDRASGAPVAVKLLHESLLRQPKLVTRFVQERTILLMLRHRNVVRVRDLFSVGETLGLVMDLVDGGSLRDHLREHHTVPAGEAARLAAQVAAALAEAHELGVIHRDLKPDNILLRLEDGRLDTRLTDFGIARILNTPSMTTPNAVVGTPHYMAPEAFHGVTASPATDVYALGVLVYELVSGRPPYDSDSIPDLMRRHMEGRPERRPGIPDGLWDLITAGMAAKPRHRPSAAEMVGELSDAARDYADVPALPPPDHAGLAEIDPDKSDLADSEFPVPRRIPAPALSAGEHDPAGGRAHAGPARGIAGPAGGIAGRPARGVGAQRSGGGAPQNGGAAQQNGGAQPSGGAAQPSGGAAQREGGASQRDGRAGQRDGRAGQRDGRAGQRDGRAGQRDGRAGQRDGSAGHGTVGRAEVPRGELPGEDPDRSRAGWPIAERGAAWGGVVRQGRTSSGQDEGAESRRNGRRSGAERDGADRNGAHPDGSDATGRAAARSGGTEPRRSAPRSSRPSPSEANAGGPSSSGANAGGPSSSGANAGGLSSSGANAGGLSSSGAGAGGLSSSGLSSSGLRSSGLRSSGSRSSGPKAQSEPGRKRPGTSDADAEAVSLLPLPRKPVKDNQAPKWRWARPGISGSIIAAVMISAAVAATIWQFGRPDSTPRAIESTRPLPATTVATARASHVPGVRKAPQHDTAPRPPATPKQHVAPAPAATTEPAPTRPVTRSPQPEAKPYGPWQCRQTIAFDFTSRLPLAPKPCQMTGRDIRYQASLTAPGGGTGSITVSLQDAGSGRTVAGPKTCDHLAFGGDAATQGCGPAGATPARGRQYTVVMAFRYVRDGRIVASTAKGSTFTW